MVANLAKGDTSVGMSVDLAALPVRPLPTADGRLASLVPGGRTVAVPGTAHHPKLADPARFNAAVLDFLRRTVR